MIPEAAHKYVYYEEPGIVLLHGDCLEVLPLLEAESVTGVLTDPPYGLGFMGKAWDHGVPGVPFWEAVGRVCKPGAMMMAFGGTRTHHRLMSAIEDAGWELRDVVMWLYGCLSEDTEVLTKSGWERFRKITKYDKIKIYDIENNIYKWEVPERWISYSVNEDTCYRIKSDNTDQIISKEHRCLIEQKGKLIFKQAWELSDMERVPILPSNFHFMEKQASKILLLSLLRKSKGLAQAIFGKWQRKEKAWKGFKRQEESSLERRRDVFQEKGKLWKIQNKICSLPKRIFNYGAKRWLRHGASFNNGPKVKTLSHSARGSASYRSQSRKQQGRKPDAICEQQTPQITRSTVTKIKYTGTLFCPTVSTGAFVARRKGKIFITGNSGFPKSLDIGKAIDKAAGAEREVVGVTKDGVHNTAASLHKSKGFASHRSESYNITVPATPEAAEWDGYKSALKPAWEPIVLAMKAVDGTFAENALRHGVAGINVDGGRLEGTVTSNPLVRNAPAYGADSLIQGPTGKGEESQGRYPANLVLDEESAAMLDAQSGELIAGTAVRHRSGGNTFGGDTPKPRMADMGYLDAGGASRFFYVAKADGKDRGHRPGQDMPLFGTSAPEWRNNHPTVKPTALVHRLIALKRYLARLMKMPKHTLLLDPFGGSGTLAVACKREAIPCIVIEKEREHLEIARERLQVLC